MSKLFENVYVTKRKNEHIRGEKFGYNLYLVNFHHGFRILVIHIFPQIQSSGPWLFPSFL